MAQICSTWLKMVHTGSKIRSSVKTVKFGRSSSNLVKMINRVKEAQTESDLIKLDHIGFNWVKSFKFVKFGLVWWNRVNLGQSGSNKANFGQIKFQRFYWIILVQNGQSGSNWIKLGQYGQSGADWVKYVWLGQIWVVFVKFD